ncbi:uncharacterized protein MONBRDRAFT_32883 [Monosiga brevicollis MX1]|uniref:Uncharacterized protein n=1 Tax=Monosiga brevicollis TaxID=81824 RepID=A9V2A2_MONBE|nr:uncharacterized protein MONBRDRAFT_32883 [Monosiga brevicollis MX1]EDQ88223.1 predicted protein [Monosiga brevicollis MX1]|eukprot:XP_001746816.1 hypothetical protein [Monosiga brevicollis MX1]
MSQLADSADAPATDGTLVFDAVSLEPGYQFTVQQNGENLTMRALAEALRNQPAAARSFHAQLAHYAQAVGGPIFWESRPCTDPESIYEAVLLPAPGLTGWDHPDLHSFDAHFRAAIAQRESKLATRFPNLDGASTLVTPIIPDNFVGSLTDYCHLSNFLLSPAITPEQYEALWHEVGTAILQWPMDDNQPLYLSTSGLGIAYLHVRLDPVPKYYTFEPYTRRPSRIY